MLENKQTMLKSQEGVVLYLALIAMTVLLGIGIGLGAVFLSQFKLFQQAGDSVISFAAADAGIERILYEDRVHCIDVIDPVEFGTSDRVECLLDPSQADLDGKEVTLPNGSKYTLTIRAAGVSGCAITPSRGYCGTSVGAFEGILRKVEIIR